MHAYFHCAISRTMLLVYFYKSAIHCSCLCVSDGRVPEYVLGMLSCLSVCGRGGGGEGGGGGGEGEIWQLPITTSFKLIIFIPHGVLCDLCHITLHLLFLSCMILYSIR